MSDYKDSVDIILTALTEASAHIEDKFESEAKNKISKASFHLGQLAATCHDLEKIAGKPIQANAKLQASHDKQRLYIGELERKVAKLQRNNSEWHDWCAEQEAKIEDLETRKEQLNSSVHHGRKIMKAIGKHK